MAIPETQLDTWSHQGSITQSSATYAAVKSALTAADSQYASRDYEVFLQGSYGNDTNIYAESDVDVVIRLDSIYYYDTKALSPDDLTEFNAGFQAATYSYVDYKAHVVAALRKRFGVSDVTSGPKAIKIKANGNRRSADVVVAADFQRHYSSKNGPQIEHGICFFDSSGNRIVNYPKKHSANCTIKHQATGLWFKPMVRILKNMRTRLIEDGAISAGSAPSYFLEGLLYNVPDDNFGTRYEDTFVAAMNWILKADRSTFICVNEEYYLARDAVAVCWPCAQCDGFIDAAVRLWNDWP